MIQLNSTKAKLLITPWKTNSFLISSSSHYLSNRRTLMRHKLGYPTETALARHLRNNLKIMLTKVGIPYPRTTLSDCQMTKKMKFRVIESHKSYLVVRMHMTLILNSLMYCNNKEGSLRHEKIVICYYLQKRKVIAKRMLPIVRIQTLKMSQVIRRIM